MLSILCLLTFVMLNACTATRADEPSPEHRLDAIERELGEPSAHIDAAQHRQIMLIGQVDSEGLWAEHGARSCAAWLSVVIPDLLPPKSARVFGVPGAVVARWNAV